MRRFQIFSQEETEGTEGLAHRVSLLTQFLYQRFRISAFQLLYGKSSVFSVSSCEILSLQIFLQEETEGTERLARRALALKSSNLGGGFENEVFVIHSLFSPLPPVRFLIFRNLNRQGTQSRDDSCSDIFTGGNRGNGGPFVSARVRQGLGGLPGNRMPSPSAKTFSQSDHGLFKEAIDDCGNHKSRGYRADKIEDIQCLISEGLFACQTLDFSKNLAHAVMGDRMHQIHRVGNRTEESKYLRCPAVFQPSDRKPLAANDAYRHHGEPAKTADPVGNI
jgi:hypothetical protein